MTSADSSSRAARYLAWLDRRLAWVGLAFLALAVLGGVLASRLALRPQFSELLPADDPAVADLDRLLSRVGATTTFLVMLKSDEPEKNRRFADALNERVSAAPPGTWRFLAYQTKDVRTFLERYGLLYLDLEDLSAARDGLKREIDRRKTGAVSLEEESNPAALLARVGAKYIQRFQQQNRFPSGYFEGGDQGRTLVFVMRPAVEALGGEETDQIYSLVDRAVQETKAALGASAQGVEVIYTGDIPAIIQEKNALKEDLGVASLVCLGLIAAALAFYFRRIWSLPLIALPALFGTLLSFALAYLVVGYLNSNTAFLGTIILGNGINYSIVLLGRYREERDQGAARREALTVAIRSTWRPTLVAAAGASIAYASLLATTFRGFNQFGLVGGVGMIFCWSLTFTLVPLLLLVADRIRPEKRSLRDGSAGLFGRFLEASARAASRRPVLTLSLVMFLSLLSLWPVRQLAEDPFEYDFRRLRNEKALVEGPGAYMDEAFAVFGRPLNPAILAGESPEQVEAARLQIIARDEARVARGERSCVGETETLGDYLPVQQSEKLSVLADIRRLLSDDALELADPAQKRDLDELRQRLGAYFPGETPKTIGFQDLPESMSSFYTEADGSRGRLMQVQLGDSLNAWDGRDLGCFYDTAGELHLPDGTRATTVGIAGVFTGMIRSMLHDGPFATGIALVLVLALLLIHFRGGRGAVVVMGGLLAGVVWMLGIGALLGMKLNFFNFVAVPITFGIASEYGVNLYERGAESGLAKLPSALRGTGGAIAICSLTTIIGYGTLLLSDNQALNSFGLIAGLGEITTLLSALLVVPAALALRDGRS